MSSRVAHVGLRRKIMSAADAAAHIRPGDNVGMSGFTGAGYPKAVPQALAAMMTEHRSRGEDFRIGVWTGASTAPELDGALAAADGIELRLPYQSDPVSRAKINAGTMEYIDVHLSHVAQMAWEGFLGHLDVALVEVTGITEDGRLVPSSLGGQQQDLDRPGGPGHPRGQRVAADGAGRHARRLLRHRAATGPQADHDHQPRRPDRRPALRLPPEKIVAIVETDAPDRNTPFKTPDEDSAAIAGHFIDFLEHEVRAGRIPKAALPLQSGVGNIANAVLAGLGQSGRTGLTAYTEVIQDGMLDLIESGTIALASATAFSLSPAGLERFNSRVRLFADRIVLRPQEISNHPEVIRRLGVIASNGMIEADIYGNVNSTHIMGSRIQNGIGGSGRLRPQRVHLHVRHALHGQGRGICRASCRWSRTSTTPSTTSTC